MTRFDKILKLKRMKVVDIASAAGVTAGHISLIGRGLRNPSLPLARRLADILGWDLRDIRFAWDLGGPKKNLKREGKA